MYMDYLKQTYNAAQEKHKSMLKEKLHILYLKFVYYKGVIVFNFEIGYFVDSELWQIFCDYQYPDINKDLNAASGTCTQTLQRKR